MKVREATMATLFIGSALSILDSGGGHIPESKGSGYKGKQMPSKEWMKRKKRLQMQKESTRKNRA